MGEGTIDQRHLSISNLKPPIIEKGKDVPSYLLPLALNWLQYTTAMPIIGRAEDQLNSTELLPLT